MKKIIDVHEKIESGALVKKKGVGWVLYLSKGEVIEILESINDGMLIIKNEVTEDYRILLDADLKDLLENGQTGTWTIDDGKFWIELSVQPASGANSCITI